MNTGERIKQRRKQIGMSAETLAKRIGKSPATVYRYEKGDIDKVDSRIIPVIAQVLGVEPGFLMGWNDAAIPTTIDSNEIELVSIYRDLNKAGQADLLRYAHYLSTDPDMKKGSESNAETA